MAPCFPLELIFTEPTPTERVGVSEFTRENENWDFRIECVSYFLSLLLLKRLAIISTEKMLQTYNLGCHFFPRKSTWKKIQSWSVVYTNRVLNRNHCELARQFLPLSVFLQQDFFLLITYTVIQDMYIPFLLQIYLTITEN